MSVRSLFVLGLALLTTAASAHAQPDTPPGESSAAFSLSSSQIFTTKDSPSIELVFQQVDHLDFRVYRVKDTLAFFAGLEDPHTLGSPEPVVPQEQTWLERVASWKSRQRADVRGFFRAQVSYDYRVARRRTSDKAEVQRRQTVGYQTFAQVPLLNKEQLISAWRELLPRVRDAEARRLPLELPGPGVYLVEAVSPPHRAYTIVMVSDVGLITKTAPGQTLLYAANRFTGEPIANCSTSVLADRKAIFTGATASDGIASGPAQAERPDDLIAVARCGDQTAATDAGAYLLHSTGRDLLGYIYTDKPIYRPGHLVNIKAVVRWRERDRVMPFDRPQLEVSIVDPDDKVLARQELKPDAFGAVHTSFTVPASGALGYYQIRIASGEETANGSFEVQEYRKPEFEVLVLPADRFVVQGRKAKVTVRARYYFGQPVAHGSLTYAIYKSGYYSPLRWREDSGDDYPADYYYGGEQIGEETVRLDENGETTLALDLPEDTDGRDYTLRLDARVTDASGREVSGKGTVVGTRGDFMVVTTLDRYVYRVGETAELRVRATDYLGAPRAGVPLAVALELVSDSGDGQRTFRAVTQGSVQTDAEGRAVWKTTVPGGSSSYRLRATASSAGRSIEDETSIWVPSPTEPTYNETEQYLEMVADRGTYAPGDTAKLLLRGVEFDATVLVTKEAQTIAWHKVISVPKGQAIEVPIDEGDVGDTWVNVVFLKNDSAYRAEKKLRVPPTSRGVQVSITAAQAVAKPRDPGIFTIRTLDAAGAPVRAQVSVAAIDEAVFAVKPDQTPDPLRFFYRRDYSRVGTQFSRDYSFTGYSGAQQLQLTQRRRRPLTLADFKADRESRPHVRKEFPDAIYWVADLVTDASGTATVKVAYPDALTTWRLTARAVTADTRVGAAISRTTTTKDLILRLITPRFLTEGDAVRLPTVVHNYLPDPRTVGVTLAARGLTPASADATAPVSESIASKGESRHEWPFDAKTVGTAVVTATATTTDDGDAVELPIPVLPYGALATVGDAGSLTGANAQAIELTIPEQSNPAARSIEVALAPSLAGSLFGALDFLADYPYGCTEQTVSSFFPNLAVMRALDELKIAPAERVRLVGRMASAGVKRLLDLQHDDGGWGWWKTDENHPFMTGYALWALTETLDAKQPVETFRVTQAATAAVKLYVKYPKAVPELKTWLVYTIARAAASDITPDPTEAAGFDLAKEIDTLWNARASMTSYGKALLLLTLNVKKDARASTLAPELAAAATTKGNLSWWDSGNDPLLDDWMDTSVEATATALRALAPHMPNDPLLERVVRHLMASRSNGYYWGSTKETALTLVGILEFLRARKEAPATVTVDVEINGRVAGTHTFTPASWTDANPVVVRADGVAGVNTIRLVPRTPGAVYWTATARYYDNRETLEQSGTRKLALSRKYFTLSPVQKNGRIVYRESPFTGSLAPGDLVLVRLTAAGSHDWKYLMLEDPLPAGMEAVQDAYLYELERPPDWWYGSKREYRDSRVVQFQSDFSKGRYDYIYLLKAVTPGRYRAMPARLSPMYAPGIAATTAPQPVDVQSGSSVAGGSR